MLDLDFLGIDLAGLNDGVIAAPEGEGNVLLYDGDGACRLRIIRQEEQ